MIPQNRAESHKFIYFFFVSFLKGKMDGNLFPSMYLHVATI